LNVLQKEAEIAVAWTGQTPAEYFQELMQDTTQPPGLRLDAARAAAVYVHRKQPEATEHTFNTPPEITIITPLTKKQDDGDSRD
jgi:hypothetical protein